MTPEDYARKLNQGFRNNFIDNLGINLLSAGQGRARATLELSPRVTQPTGLFHAGAIIGLADTTATCACLAETNPDAEPRPDLFPLAIQLSSNLMRNTSRGSLRADAELIHRGRTTMVVDVRVIDDRAKLVANVVVTLLVPAAAAARPTPARS